MTISMHTSLQVGDFIFQKIIRSPYKINKTNKKLKIARGKKNQDAH